ncbi:biotin/lipoyl-binding protein [Rhodoferax sp.]|uniref:efflux RND transporter periplasmic adaptor subunit n=1 Tax=Rhodoferax sp. TaxID=50421 RepID=UPI0028519760|nr:biotin/lipoyl-binding protein [Rhodoferax sp.]MDR3368910.1 biotin/lipoyl-binding protein [Rhodoferax sp.]
MNTTHASPMVNAMSKPKSKKTLIAIVVLVLVAGAVLAVVKQKSRLAAETLPAATPVTVQPLALTRGPVTLTLPLAAEVQAVQEANIASRLTGYVTALRFSEGDSVKKGDLLVQIDTADALANLQRAQADLARIEQQQASLQADLAAADVAARAANERTARDKTLYEIKGVSLEQLQAEQTNQASALARLAGTRGALNAYQSGLSAAKSGVQAAQINLGYADMRAPFDALVAARPVQMGDLATPGKLLIRLVGLREQRLLVTLPEGVMPQALLLNGQELSLKPWPEATAQGMHRYEARANGLTPGTRVSVQLLTFKAEGVLLPDACLLGNDGHTATVFQLPKDGPAKPLKVSLQAAGSEGSVSLDASLRGQTVACGGADVLTRLSLGVPFQLAKGH